MAEENVSKLEDKSNVKREGKPVKRVWTEPSGIIASWLAYGQLESQKERGKKREQRKSWRNNDQGSFSNVDKIARYRSQEALQTQRKEKKGGKKEGNT